MADSGHAHPLALSDRTGTATLIQRADNSGASRLGDDADGLQVEVNTLDEFCAESGLERLDVVKIDVEGYESRVLRGGAATLSKFKPALVVEFWTTGVARAGTSVDEIADILGKLGYGWQT